MKRIGLLSLIMTVFIGLSQPARGGSGHRGGVYWNGGYYYPGQSTYDSLGTVQRVRNVQLALQDRGYYVGDDQGNYCAETRKAVRRYRWANGLAVTGKIDSDLLRSLGVR